MAIKKKAAAKPAATAKKKAATTKAASVKKAAPAKAVSVVKAAMTKTALFQSIADVTEVSKKDVSKVFDALASVIEAHIKKNAVGTFTLPGLMKVKTIRKPATKARKGINPFTGEETMFKAKPARTAVKILPLKKVKDMVA